MRYGGVKIKWSLTTGVFNAFTCIHMHCRGRVADRPLRCYLKNTHNRKNGGNIYNARNCRISIAMKIFLLYFRY